MYAIRMNNGGIQQNLKTQREAAQLLREFLAKDLLPPKMQAGRIGIVIRQKSAFEQWERALHGALEVWISDCAKDKVYCINKQVSV